MRSLRWISFCFWGWCLIPVAEAQSVAVYFDIPEINLPVNKRTYNEMKDLILNQLGLDARAYVMEGSNVRLDTTFRKGEDQVASSYLLSVYLDVYQNYSPDLTFATDTTGKLTATSFVLKANTRYRYMLTDLRTHEILHIERKYGQSYPEVDPKLIPVEYKKYFKEADPIALKKNNPKAYNDIYQKILSDFRSQFEKFYYDMRPYDLLDQLSSTIISPILNIPRPVESPVLDKGKLATFRCPLPEVLKFYNGMRMNVFALDTIDEFIVPINYYYWVIDEVGPSGCLLEPKFMVKSKDKEAGEAFAAGKQLYYLPGTTPYGRNLNEKENIVFDIRGVDVARAANIYKFLTRSSAIKCINSQDEKLITALHERYKEGRFVDSGYSIAALGARYIISTTSSEFVLQDAQSGTVLANSALKSGEDGVFDLLQKNLGLKIRIIKILDSKKDVLKEALVYSPLGFSSIEGFVLVRRTGEKVGDRTIMREEEIGKGNIVNPEDWGYIFGEARFNKGEKEAYAAYMNKLDILFLTGK